MLYKLTKYYVLSARPGGRTEYNCWYMNRSAVLKLWEVGMKSSGSHFLSNNLACVPATASSSQYFDHLVQRADSLEKTLLLGKIEGRKRRGRQHTRWLDSIIDSMDRSLSKLQKKVKDRKAWPAAVLWVAKRQTLPSDRTATWMSNE